MRGPLRQIQSSRPPSRCVPRYPINRVAHQLLLLLSNRILREVHHGVSAAGYCLLGLLMNLLLLLLIIDGFQTRLVHRVALAQLMELA